MFHDDINDDSLQSVGLDARRVRSEPGSEESERSEQRRIVAEIVSEAVLRGGGGLHYPEGL